MKVNGWFFLGLGAFAVVCSAAIDRGVMFSADRDWVSGFLAGVATVAFGAAIYLLVLSSR